MNLRRYVYRALGWALITGVLVAIVMRAVVGVSIEIAILAGVAGALFIFGRAIYAIWR